MLALERFKNKMTVTVRGIIITEYRQHPLEFDTGGVGRDQDN